MNDTPQPSPALVRHCQAMTQRLMAAPHYALYHDFVLSCCPAKAQLAVRGYELIGDQALGRKAGKELARLVARSSEPAQWSAQPETEAALVAGGFMEGLLEDRRGASGPKSKELLKKLADFFTRHPQQAEKVADLLRHSPYRDYFAKTLGDHPASLAAACRDYFSHASRADCAILGHGMLGIAPPPGLYAISAGEDKSYWMSEAYLEDKKKHPPAKSGFLTETPKETLAFIKRIYEPDAAPMQGKWQKELTTSAADKQISEREIKSLLDHIRLDLKPLGIQSATLESGMDYLEKNIRQYDAGLRPAPKRPAQDQWVR